MRKTRGFISTRAGDKSAEHVASFNEQRDPLAKPAVLQYFGKTAVNNKIILTLTVNLMIRLRSVLFDQ